MKFRLQSTILKKEVNKEVNNVKDKGMPQMQRGY